ncbi:MAG TPA: hypothetical protein VF163_16330 [Micromonosporaceae bacterium]
MDKQLQAMGAAIRAQRDADFRARRGANNRVLGLSKDATPEQVHAALMRASER